MNLCFLRKHEKAITASFHWEFYILPPHVMYEHTQLAPAEIFFK